MPGPLVAWGTPENLSFTATWTRAFGAAVNASASLSPFGESGNVWGLSNAAGQQSAVFRNVVVPPNTTLVVPIVVRLIDAPNAGLQLTNGTNAATLQINFSSVLGRAASVQQEFASGGVTVAGAIVPVGTGGEVQPEWTLIIARFSGMPAGPATLRLYPNLLGFAAAQSTLFFLQPTWTHYLPLDDARAAPRARVPSELVVAPSGIRDTWDFGTDFVLSGALRRVPADASTFLGEESSGYYGAGTGIVGLGLESLLIAGSRATVLRYCRDRANAASFVDGYLEAPTGEISVEIERDGTMRQPVQLVAATSYRGVR